MGKRLLLVVMIVFVGLAAGVMLLLQKSNANRLNGGSESAPAAASTSESYLPLVVNPQPTPTPTSTPTSTPTRTPTATAVSATPVATSLVLESFEGADTSWVVTKVTTGSGSVTRSSALANTGSYSALASTNGSGAKAMAQVSFSAPVGMWQERPGTWYWQQASVYLPSATVNQLGAGDYLTLGGFWPSAGGTFGWWLRVRQGGQLYVYGYDSDGNAKEFRVYGTFPQNQWAELTLGLHSQYGPGVKRAFAFLINGSFYGWYHQGHMQAEVYNRAAIGILDTNRAAPLQVFIDAWRAVTTGQFPAGPDNRPTAAVQEQNYRSLSGIQWQIDWSTWGLDLRMDPRFGLYSATSRLQSGRNIDRMPSLQSGWAEIEVDWPQGTPPNIASGYYGPMVGFRKEINREENLEVIPIGRGGGLADLVLEAWVNGGPVFLAGWPLPAASTGSMHIPEPGDIIRVRWEQVSATQLDVKASFYDASANTWHTNIINTTFNSSAVQNGGVTVNFNDGYHLASSITIDSPYYSIRRYKVGTLATYP